MNARLRHRESGRSAIVVAVIALGCFQIGVVHAKPLGQATVTQVNNDVRFKPSQGEERPAKAKDIVKGSDTVRTGQKSQAELEFEDRTITRLGSNSSFTFDPEKREFQLHKGLLLFDMPKGAGGGKIITPAGTAAIEGTAGIVTYRSQPKVICLAGVINVLTPNGQLAARVMPGQLFIVGVTKRPVDFNLSGVKAGKLLSGGLPNNKEEFTTTTDNQQKQMQTGQLQSTPFVVVGDKTDVLVATPGGGGTTGGNTGGTSGDSGGTGGSGGGTGDIPPPVLPDREPPPPPPPPRGTEALNYTKVAPKAWDGKITSGDVINASAATLSDSASPPRYETVTGTVDPTTGIATYDAGTLPVTITGAPKMETTANQDAKVSLKTSATLTATGVGDTYQGTCDTVLFHAEAGDISIQGSEFRADSNTRGRGSLALKAANNLFVSQSEVGAGGYRGATSTPLYDAGSIRIEGGHVVSLSGTGWPTGRAEVQAGGVNGGTVEIKSTGTAAGDMVYLHHAGVDATASAAPVEVPDSNTETPEAAPASAGARGGSVNIQSNVRVQMDGTTLIQASGPVPGAISVTASGTATSPGVISLDAQNGIVGLLATTLRVADNESFSLIDPKQIAIIGNTPFGSSDKTIQFSAPGGWALFSAENEVAVRGARVDVSGTGSQNAGMVWMGKYNASLQPLEKSHYISLRGTEILANATSGRGGAVKFMADADSPDVYREQAIRVGPNTDIQANSAGGAGTITFSVEGGTARAAQIGFDTERHDNSGNLLQEGFVRMTAVNSSSLGAPPDPGNILIQGATFSDGSKSIKLIAHNTIGGQIKFNAKQSVTVNDALVDVDPTGPAGLWVSMGYYDQSAHQDLATGRISLTGTLINGNASAGQGANLWLTAYDSVNLQHGTDIQLNGGGAAGMANVEARGRSGTPSSAGQVTITASGQRGVRLSAQQTAAALNALLAGNVEILGSTVGTSDKSIHIWAGAPGGGVCQISITAPQALMLQHAMLEANAVTGGGTIGLTGKNVTLVGALLRALGTGTSSAGGTISLVADALGTLSLTDSSLWAYGGTGMGGTITLRGGTVNFSGGNDLNAGSTGDIYIYRDSGSALPSGITGNVHVLPFSSSFTITSADTMDASTLQIVNNGSTRLTGTLVDGVVEFDFGAANVTVTSSPNVVPASGGIFHAEFKTTGTLAFNNVPEDTSPGGPDARSTLLTFRASAISFANSVMKVGGDETLPCALSLFADGNVLVDPSTLKVFSGPTDGSANPVGVLHIESTGGLLSFVGSGYDSVGDPTDALRTHGSATVKAGTGLYNGGSVELVSGGQTTILDNGVTKPYDGVFIHDATIAASPRDNNGNWTSGAGGQVLVDGRMQVLIEDTVDIDANGASPGTVNIQSSGNGTLAGVITLSAPTSIGHINIGAQDTVPSFSGGDINFFGMNTEGGYSINLTAGGPLGGGTIRARAFGGYYAPSSWVNSYYAGAGILVVGSRFSADTPSGVTASAGAIFLEAPGVFIGDSYLSANSGADLVGQIHVDAKNPNGTRVGTMINIANSMLTVGGTTDPNGGIYISGDTVVIDPISLGNFSVGPAQVHIQSRQMDSMWSSYPIIQWTPLYFIMDNATTIDVSSALPAIVRGGNTMNGTFNGSGAAMFDFGTQNVLLWPNNPVSVPTPAGMFNVEFYTGGSFESVNMTPGTGGGTGPAETSRVSIHAGGIQIINSIFNMGDNNAPNGRSEFVLVSSTDALVVSPFDSMNSTAPATVIAPKTGMDGSIVTGGKFHLESDGVTALIGGDPSARLTKVLVGSTQKGGRVDILSTSTDNLANDKMNGVHLRNAFIDASHAITTDYPSFTLTSASPQEGGVVSLTGQMQVNIEGSTDIYADGSTIPGFIYVTSAGTSVQPGRVNFHIESGTTPGHIFLSAQKTDMGTMVNSGNLALYGATLGDGTKTVDVKAYGPTGGGMIVAEAPGTVFIGSASLDASVLSGPLPGGTIRLLAGASSSTPVGSVQLQTAGATLRARGFDGGTVTTEPLGSVSYTLPANLDMHGTVIDVSSYGGTATGNTPQGGRVSLRGTMNAAIYGDQYGSTDISADGPTAANGAVAGSSAGSINVSSPGDSSLPGNVTILGVEPDRTRYVRLSAQDSAVVFDALANGGNVEIHGASGRARGNETVKITATGPSGGGNITISAIEKLSVINAQLNAGGNITLNGKNIHVENSLLTAALIAINATATANIWNSVLQAGTINIHAPTVDFAGSTLSSQAQVYATTVVNPPASGTINQHPYTP